MAKICYIPKKFNPTHTQWITWANGIIEEYLKQGFGLTVRQLYYQFVARDLLRNLPENYNKLADVIKHARLAGQIDWDAIVDRGRTLRAIHHYEHPRDILAEGLQDFALWKWKDQPNYVEVWVEKDALRDIVAAACNPNDVGYFSSRGYSSVSGLHEAAMRFKHETDQGKTVHLLHLSDHDPSGIDMTRNIIESIKHTFAVPIKVFRIGLNMDQIERFRPPPNPAKVSDPRAEAYIEKHGDSSWELDSLEPSDLVALIDANIKHRRDQAKWDRQVKREEKAKNLLKGIHDRWNEVIHLVNNPPEETES